MQATDGDKDPYVNMVCEICATQEWKCQFAKYNMRVWMIITWGSRIKLGISITSVWL